MTPAVSHNLFIFRQQLADALNVSLWRGPGAGNMALREGLMAPSIQENEIKLARLYRLEHVIALLFRMKFVDEVVAVGTYLIGRKLHNRLPNLVDQVHTIR